MKNQKLALVTVEAIESEDRPSTRITSVEPTIVVYEVGGDDIVVEMATPCGASQITSTVFERSGPLDCEDVYLLLQKLGFANVELIGSRKPSPPTLPCLPTLPREESGRHPENAPQNPENGNSAN